MMHTGGREMVLINYSLVYSPCTKKICPTTVQKLFVQTLTTTCLLILDLGAWCTAGSAFSSSFLIVIVFNIQQQFRSIRTLIMPTGKLASVLFACLGLQGTLLLQFVAFDSQVSLANAVVPCSSTSECENTLQAGSECVGGFCNNPFLKGGCLQKMKPGWTKTRVCNSEDPPDAAEKGYCHLPDSRFDYGEIRISPQNWMSVSVETWVLQILLSEILDVPVTVETSLEDINSNFYDAASRLQFGEPNDFEALETAKLLGGDCTQVEQEPGNYRSCSHFIPENWLGLNPEVGLEDLFGYDPSTEALEPPLQLGSISQEGWHIPRFTAERDPSLLSFMGLEGEENRRKLAERFLRPTSWQAYCEEVSANNCTTPDLVAARAPVDDAENGSYFAHMLYTGHFRQTDENDCDRNPMTCTGHIADFPCGWSSNVRTVAFWHNIALESSGGMPGSRGYEYSQLVQIMMAANATKSDLMILWWYPDLDFQRYLGSDAELMKVSVRTGRYRYFMLRRLPHIPAFLSLFF
jgi:hypothetical protein